MRLLDAWLLIHENIAELVEFPDERSAPPYAILSHTWEHEEVLFSDIPLGPRHEIVPSRSALRYRQRHSCAAQAATHDSKPHIKAGWNKVLNTCMQACRDELEYVWIDTCCIDKTSSAELSEAINSMYRWYESATVCYVFLADYIASIPSDLPCDYVEPEASQMHACERLRKARWFQRGWTLQELLAPKEMMFFDASWRFISRKNDMLCDLTSITGIHMGALEGQAISGYSVAQRMYWASKRKTTRLEDEAYCLLGLFGIDLPLIYGEGVRAFRRLQEALVRTSSDQSILAWELLPGIDGPEVFHALLAPRPANFWWCVESLRPRPRLSRQHQQEPQITWKTHGAELITSLDRSRNEYHFNVDIAVLDCTIRLDVSPGVPYREAKIGVRLRSTAGIASSLRAAPSMTLYTQVEPELVSTITEPQVVYKRLAFLPPMSKASRDHTPSTIFISMTESYRCKRNHRAMRSAQGTLRFKFDTVAETEPDDLWRSIAVWPRNQWFASSQTMTMPNCSEGTFAALVFEHRTGFRCTLIIYHKRDQHTSSLSLQSTKYVPRYWLLPGNPVLRENLVDAEGTFRFWSTWAQRRNNEGPALPVRRRNDESEGLSLCEPLHQICNAMEVIFRGPESSRIAWESTSGMLIHCPGRNTMRLRTSNYRLCCDYSYGRSTGEIHNITMRFTTQAAQTPVCTGLGDPRGFAVFSAEHLVVPDKNMTYYMDLDHEHCLSDARCDVLKDFEAWGLSGPAFRSSVKPAIATESSYCSLPRIWFERYTSLHGRQ